MALKP